MFCMLTASFLKEEIHPTEFQVFCQLNDKLSCPRWTWHGKLERRKNGREKLHPDPSRCPGGRNSVSGTEASSKLHPAHKRGSTCKWNTFIVLSYMDLQPIYPYQCLTLIISYRSIQRIKRQSWMRYISQQKFIFRRFSLSLWLVLLNLQEFKLTPVPCLKRCIQWDYVGLFWWISMCLWEGELSFWRPDVYKAIPPDIWDP